MDKKVYDKYLEWLNCKFITDQEREELESLKGNDTEIEDRFYTDLSFGTGGIRGVRGLGTNRINKYLVRKVTQGLANYINKYGENKSCAIAYDCRIGSEEYALNTALVLVGNGVKAYLFRSMHSTPELSFAVRELKTQSGIVITASHNPQEYNGYKVYWDDGAQVVDPHATGIVNEVNEIKDFSAIKIMSKDEAIEKGLLVMINEDMDSLYLEKVKEQQLNKDIPEKNEFKIVYTPLHGTGGRPVLRVLAENGFKAIYPVKEQLEGDGMFPTCSYANPEDSSVYRLGVELAEKVGANIVLATDPDADRVGIACKDNKGNWIYPNGNELGVLLLNYILENRKAIPKNAAVISTIVSTPMLDVICKAKGVQIFRTLTGFKYIGEKIRAFENKKIDGEYIFGFEESVGYLIGTHVRDKDAIVTAMLIAEMAAKYAAEGKNIVEVLTDIYDKYGWYKDSSTAVTKKGKEGMEEISKIMKALSKLKDTRNIIGKDIDVFRDYKNQIEVNHKTGKTSNINFPISDVIQFVFQDGTHITVRPSGTEPKIKYYCSVVGKSKEESDCILQETKNKFECFVESCIK